MTATNFKKIAILGAGISGLTCAYYLKKRGVDVTVYEKETRVGGLIRSTLLDGFLFEYGPRSIRLKDAESSLDLISELGLDLITASLQDRYLLHKGKLEKLPNSFRDFFSSPLMEGTFFGILKDLFTSKSKADDESVHAFFSQRFSPLIADRFIDPLIKGIYAGDSKNLSIQACFPYLTKYRSLILGALLAPKSQKRGPATLKGGMEELPKRLGLELKENIQLGRKIERLSFDSKATLHTNSQIFQYDQVISTLPAYALADLMPESKFQKLLLSIPFSSVGVVHLGYRTKVNPYRGFGYLVPSIENEKILGCIFDENSEKTSLTVMIQGKDNLEDIAIQGLKRHLGITCLPDICNSYHAMKAIPQYPVGFLSLLKEIEKEKPTNLDLLGTSFHGVSVNHCIATAKKLAFQKSFGSESGTSNP